MSPGRDRSRALIVAAAPLALALALLTGPVQDYVAHLHLWSLALHGRNPYVPGLHAYGPAFNAFALLAELHPLAPKLLFVGVWLGSAWWLVGLARRMHPGRPRLALGIALFLLNPWFWSEIPVYAHFDITVAAACLAAVHASVANRPDRAGAMLSLGILLKFLPAALLPSIMLEPRENSIRLRPLLVCLGVVLIGFGVVYLLYGDAIFGPFRFGANRPSSGFSIFDYLRRRYSILRLFTNRPNVDALSTPALLAALVVTGLLVLRHRLDAPTSALLLILATLTLYRAGHSQFQAIPALLAPYWYLVHVDEIEGRWVTASLALYFGWLLFETVAWVTGPWRLFMNLEGLVHFVISVNLYAALLRHGIALSRRVHGRPALFACRVRF